MTDHTKVPTDRSSAISRLLRRLAAGIVMVVSGVYLWHSLRGQVGQLPLLRLWMPMSFWIPLFAGCVVTLLLGVAYHVIAVRRLAPVSSASITDIALAYTLGQLARYIPGKVVGLLFQVKLLEGRVPPGSVLFALVVQTVYDYAWAVLFCAAVLGYAFDGTLTAAIAVLALAVYGLWYSHRHALCERLLARVMPARWKPDLDSAAIQSRAWSASLALTMVWSPMLAGLALGLAGHLEVLDALQLGCYYILAAMGSLLVFIVPSGLALREALFVWLGQKAGADPTLLLFIGVAFRICLTLAEIASAALCGAASGIKSWNSPRSAPER